MNKLVSMLAVGLLTLPSDPILAERDDQEASARPVAHGQPVTSSIATPDVDLEGQLKELAGVLMYLQEQHQLFDKTHQQRHSAKSGSIVVGPPRVYTRERLVNDRAEQDAWLRKVLKASESVTDFGVQGFRDRRTARAFSSSTGAKIDSGALDLYLTSVGAQENQLKRDEQLAAIEHRIAMAKKLQELQEASQGDIREPIQNVALPNTSTDGSDSTDSAGATTVGEAEAADAEAAVESTPTFDIPSNDPAMAAFFESLTNKEKSLLADPNGLVRSQAKGTPLDLFKDQLAYRDAIRTELFQNSLDDAHDLAGNTTYTLSFDLTVLSARKKNRWGRVEITVEEPLETSETEELYEQWVKDLNSYLNGVKRAWELLLEEQALPPDLESQLLSIAFSQLEGSTLTTVGENDPSFPRAVKDVFGENTPPPVANLRPVDLLDVLRSQSRTREALMASLVLEELQIEKQVGAYVRLGGEPIPQRSDTNKLEVRSLIFQRDLSTEEADRPLVKKEGTNSIELKPRGIRLLGTTAVIELASDDAKKTAWLNDLKARSASRVVTYAVTPREQADRISEVTSDRQALQVLANLQAVIPGKGGLKQAINYMNESQEISQALRRHPLVVGFSSGGGSATAQANFGWILGGRFGLEHKSRWFGPDTLEPSYQHTPASHSVSAIVSVPSWWKSVRVTARTFWRNAKKSTWREDGTYPFTVSLPGDVSGIASVNDSGSWRFPTISKPKTYHHVRANAPARILVEGDHLWRSTMVTLGSQHTRNVVVLPNMRGIIATFDSVESPPEGFGSIGYADRNIRVWTSEGQVYAGDARIYPAEGPKKVELKIVGDRLLKDGLLRVAVTRGKLPEAFDWLGIGVRGYLEGEPGSMTDWEKIEAVIPNLGDPIEVKVSSSKLKTAMTIQAALIVRSRPEGSEKLTRAAGSLVYYATAADSRAMIKNWNKNLKLGDSLEIQMPKRWLAAYPGFKLTGSKVTGKVVDPANQTTLTVKLDALAWRDATAGVVKGHLASDTADALHILRCSQPVKIGWTLEAAGNATLVLAGADALQLDKGPMKKTGSCP